MEKVQSSDLKDVLLAEDDQDDVLYFELALRELPLTVVLRNARDGERLFVMLKEHIPDILFLDIDLPCKDGITCIAEIRSNREYDKMPVIMYTSFTDNKSIEASYRKGANLYMIKSAGIKELASNLKSIFDIDWKSAMFYPAREQFLVNSQGEKRRRG